MMISRYPEITDDLLSAYIDGAVTGAERIAVEQAAATDPDVAWRLKTLQETVQLLRMLPTVAAPRSFVMTAEQVGGATSAARLPDSVSLQQARVARTDSAPAERSLGAWERMAAGWHNLWQRGNLPLRNAMAASMALLLLLLLVPSLLSPPANPITFQTSLAPAVPASDFLSNTLAASEAQNRAQPLVQLVQRAAPVSAGVTDAREPEAPLSEATTVDWSATPEQTMQNVAAGEAATAAPAMAAAAPAASGARVLAAQPSVDPAGLPATTAGVDALAFAPAAADQAVVEELTGAGAVVPPAAAALPKAAPGSGSAEPGEKLSAEPAQPAVPVAAAPVAVPTPLPQPAVTPVAAPTDRPVQLLPTAVDDTAAALPAEGAALPTVPPTAQGQTWLWFQWLAAFAVVVFGFLWWRSRRAP